MSLTMIVKDEKRNVPRCIESMRGVLTRLSLSIRGAPIGPSRSPALLVPRSLKLVGTDEFDPYAMLAERWIKALDAKVVVELGYRTSRGTRWASRSWGSFGGTLH